MTTPLASFPGSVFQFIAQGGFFMFLLVACSVTCITVIVLCALNLRRKNVMPEIIEQTIDGLRPGDDMRKLDQLVQGDPSSLGRIITTALRHLEWTKSDNMEAVQTTARHEMVRLDKGLAVLELLVGMGPLLGLLGTVTGLVRVFGSLGLAHGGDPSGIAAGIAEALNTTIVGLAVAIPSLIAHSYFSKRIEMMAAEMEAVVAELIAKCYSEKNKPRGHSGPSEPEHRPAPASAPQPPPQQSAGLPPSAAKPAAPARTGGAAKK